MRWLAATAVLVVLATSACSGDDEPQPKAPAATPDRAATACSLLSSADRQELTGQEVDTISDRARAAIGLQCRWADADTFVEASSLPAADWAMSLPGLIDGLRGSGQDLSAADDARLDKIAAAVEGSEDLTAEEACQLFPTIAEVTGAEPGSDDLVVFVPVGGELGVQAQTCTEGVFSSVVFSTPGLTESDAVEQRARAALETAHDRAIDSGALST